MKTKSVKAARVEKVVTELEPTPDTWSPDDLIKANLALGELRGAIDVAKAAADKLHRARKCPDAFLVKQFAELEVQTRHLQWVAGLVIDALKDARKATRA